MMSASVEQLGLQDEELRASYQKYPVPVDSQVTGMLAKSLQWIPAFPATAGVRDDSCCKQSMSAFQSAFNPLSPPRNGGGNGKSTSYLSCTRQLNEQAAPSGPVCVSGQLAALPCQNISLR